MIEDVRFSPGSSKTGRRKAVKTPQDVVIKVDVCEEEDAVEDEDDELLVGSEATLYRAIASRIVF